MASGWHNKLARLSQMDWEEVRTRVGQEFHKRSDLLRYRLGIEPPAVRLSDSPSRKSRFFFAGSEIAERAGLLRTHLPEEAAGILREADEICGHRFRLLGFENLDYGSEIDWHLDRVHGKRAPLDPWPRIPFLEFAVAGDHKVTWELNRHQHLVTLAKAGLLSGDEKYVNELIAQWRSWMQANPYPLGINWASTLEVAFRSLSWIWVDHLLSETPGHAEFRSGLAQWNCVPRPLHRKISVDLLLAQHAPAGRSGRAVLDRNSLSADSGGGALAADRMADRAAGGATAGPSGWRLLRAIAVLPRVRAGLLSLRADFGGPEWAGHSSGFR